MLGRIWTQYLVSLITNNNVLFPDSVMKKYQNKNWLYQKYVVEKLSADSVAGLCDAGQTTIFRWLKKHNIKTRTRFEAQIVNLHSQYCPLEERLWAKIDKKDNISECWPWIGCKENNRYGQIKINNKNKRLHIVMYEYFYKTKIGENECVHHLCNNKACCNPFHLIKISHNEHSILHNGGENSYWSKLTIDEVRQIKNMYNFKRGQIKELAEQYNVSVGTISGIINNKKWKNV